MKAFKDYTFEGVQSQEHDGVCLIKMLYVK